MVKQIKKYEVKDEDFGDVFGGLARPRSLPICIYCMNAVRNISYRGTIGEYVCDICWEDRNPGSNS